MAKRDYYEILGVNKNASKEEIKKAYKKLAMKFHPDVSKDKDAEAKFKEVSEAYAVLSDDAKKGQYDQFGHNAFDQRYSQEDIFRGFDFGSIFEEFGVGGDNIFDMFFGGGRRTRQRRGNDLRSDLTIAFEEAASGIERAINVHKQAICEKCDGTGAKDKEVDECKECRGQGRIRKSMRTPFGSFTQTTTCGACGGEGLVAKYKCSRCNGSGTESANKKIKVKIPAGVETGSTLRVSGEGEAVKGGKAGDLYVVIHVKEHDFFKRENDDIHVEANISFSQAALGDITSVKTLEGEVKLKIPAGTQSGTVFRLKGKGMPNINGYSRGDQYVIVNVKTPEKLNKRQTELFIDMAKENNEQLADGKGILGKFKDAFR